MIRMVRVLVKGETYISAFIGLIWEAPFFLFFMTGFLIYPSFASLAGLFTCIPATFCLLTIGIQLAALHQYKEVLQFLEKFPTLKLLPCDLTTVISCKDIEDLIGGLGLDRFPKRMPINDVQKILLHVYTVTSDKSTLPSQFKCFPFINDPPIIFIMNKTEPSTDFGLYIIYHELGHAHPAGAVHHARKYSGLITSIVTIYIIFATSGFALPPWQWSLFAIFVSLRNYGNSNLADSLQESTADLWALSRLKNRINTTKVIDQRIWVLEQSRELQNNSSKKLQLAVNTLLKFQNNIKRNLELPEVLVWLPSVWVWILSSSIIVFFGFVINSTPATHLFSFRAIFIAGLIMPIGWIRIIILIKNTEKDKVRKEIRGRT